MVLISLGALELFVEHIDIVFHKFMVVISPPMYTDQLICYMLFLTVTFKAFLNRPWIFVTTHLFKNIKDTSIYYEGGTSFYFIFLGYEGAFVCATTGNNVQIWKVSGNTGIHLGFWNACRTEYFPLEDIV